MAARLGYVIYWLGCLAAGILVFGPLILMFVIWPSVEPVTSDYWLIGYSICLGVVSWMIGRAARYILAGT
jgi:hypothetical protein